MEKSKKALELSINFIVVVIISLVVFGMGLYIANQFFGEAEKIKESLDQQTERQIESMLDTGQRVAIPIDSKVIQIGKSDIFGLGILNILGDAKVFTVSLSSSLYVGANKQTENPPLIPVEFIETHTREIKNNEQLIIPIAVRVPKNARPGTYIINVNVDQYEETLQITVRVP